MEAAVATAFSLTSMPVTRHPDVRARYSAGPPEPLATSSASSAAVSPSFGSSRSYSSAVIQLFWPISSPNVAWRMSARTRSVKWPYVLSNRSTRCVMPAVYSGCSTLAGLSLDARHAGIIVATTAMPITRRIAAVSISGSDARIA